MSARPPAAVLPFPHAAVRPARAPARRLGRSRLVVALRLDEAGLSGHWCSRCQGIWEGLHLEVECPACGSRKG